MNIRNLISHVSAVAVLIAGALLPFNAQASIVLAGTRVVFNAADTEVTLKMTNNGKLPGLAQVWLDTGDADADPTKVSVPFLLTPPVARIDPTKSQTVRITYTGEPLAQDKETLFWFNMLEIPPKPDAKEASANYMQLAFRSRIKFFYRPAGLSISPTEAPKKLTWHASTQAGKPALQINNPTPYYITVAEATVGRDANVPKSTDSIMVAPGGNALMPMSASVKSGQVFFQTVDDYGASLKYDAALQ
ncbi:fimbria/pilus periplasmic chaperone [Silvimonas amylolytica]|uniref:Fimbrial chaperone n=1 Tax=Silvimonas amylolytica TaxID=449663 RepID=A0ABQ2PJD9_9NEIS|nr:fimbria/pilus periplasmic chaperone [Silvimonas amylolytica]GGP25094.1 fimbrial chaperone [Silvimonas amylolytica]